MKAAALRVAVQKHEAAVQALDAVRSEMETLRVRVPQLQAWVDAFDLADKLSKLIAKLTTSHPSHDDAIRSIVSRAVR